MKRITYWPQAFLGITFNWGALVGYAAVTGRLDRAALLLYAAGFFWTLGYDTLYAHQDKEDDALIGVKSTALLLGTATPRWLLGFYGCTLVSAGAAGCLAGKGWLFYLALLAGGLAAAAAGARPAARRARRLPAPASAPTATSASRCSRRSSLGSLG